MVYKICDCVTLFSVFFTTLGFCILDRQYEVDCLYPYETYYSYSYGHFAIFRQSHTYMYYGGVLERKTESERQYTEKRKKGGEFKKVQKHV